MGGKNLKTWTRARIALNSTGSQLPSQHLLTMAQAQAQAKDAIQFRLDFDSLARSIAGGVPAWPVHRVQSQVKDRQQYLLRPDLGRLISDASRHDLERIPLIQNGIDICIVDGLSPLGIQKSAAELAQLIVNGLAPEHQGQIFLVSQGRVAIGDQIGDLTLYASRGIGACYPPVRFNCRSELVLHELTAAR